MAATAITSKRAFPVDPPKVIVGALLLLVVAAGFIVSDRFGTTRNFMNVLEQAAALGFVSLGQTVVVLVGGIDLSIGAVVTAATVFIAAMGAVNPDLMPVILVAALAAGALIGAINGLLVIGTGVHPLIVTIGTGTILNGVVLLYTLQPTGKVPAWFEEFAYGRILGVPIAGIVMLVCFVIAGAFLRDAPLGRAILAVGGGSEAARLVGIRSNAVTVFAYAACGVFAALAGAYFAARTGVGDPRVGDPMTLASITPVIVGGTVLGGGRGGFGGTLLGVLLISLLNNLLNYMNVSTFIQWVIQGMIIIVAVSIYVNRTKRL